LIPALAPGEVGRFRGEMGGGFGEEHVPFEVVAFGANRCCEKEGIDFEPGFENAHCLSVEDWSVCSKCVVNLTGGLEYGERW
jgi:hypothetical protein